MKQYVNPEFVNSKANRREKFQVKYGAIRRIISWLETIKGIMLVVTRVLARDKIVEIYKKNHSSPSQPVSPESVNNV